MKVIHLSKEEITHLLEKCFKAGVSTSITNEVLMEVEKVFKIYYNFHSGQWEKIK